MAILRWSWRGSTNSKKYILQLICVKKDCFYPIQVLEMKFLNFLFISQRPKNWLKFPNKTWFFQVWTSFQLELGAARWNLNLVFRGNMGKNVLFLACRSVRNSFLQFLVHVLGSQTQPSGLKYLIFGFQTYISSRAQNWEGGLPNNFPR